MAARYVENVRRLADTRHPASQTAGELLTLLDAAPKMTRAVGPVRVVQIVGLDPVFDETAHQHFEHACVIVDATQQHALPEHRDTRIHESCTGVLPGRGELVGLLFDGNYESMIADWDYLPEITRSIHVDMRYVLWLMQEVDGAHRLLKEMGQ